jgi:hypothetical protein
VNTQVDESQVAQPETPPKAPWQTPTLTDLSVEKLTASGGGSGGDFTAGPNGS